MQSAPPRVSYRLSACALVTSLLLTVVAYVAFARQAEVVLASQAKLEKSSLVVRTLRDVRDDLIDMESGQRGFLLTADINYLAPFYRGQSALHQHLTDLEKQVSGFAPEDAGTLLKLKQLAIATEKELLSTIAGPATGNPDQSEKILRTAIAKQYMDEVRSIIDTQAAEYRTERGVMLAEVRTEVARARLALSVAGIALILLVGAAFLNMRVSTRKLKIAAERLSEEATHDALTGLPNRRYLFQWLEPTLARAKRQGERISALYLDLDGFAQVNNTQGHEAGDRVLKRVADLLKLSTRESDFIARQGGDEFVIVVCGMDDMQLIVLAKKIVQTLAQVSPDAGNENLAGVSIGVATAQPDKDDAASLLKKADEAMYQAKSTGKNAFCFYGAD